MRRSRLEGHFGAPCKARKTGSKILVDKTAIGTPDERPMLCRNKGPDAEAY